MEVVEGSGNKNEQLHFGSELMNDTQNINNP
jgi:hypothetical protein